ncbi:MAG TPA: tetratricopeptide repeat protein [Thermoanaerobaculia bacterium]|nr:tetratricopeptide repeat protein [Thermoanaerobaculia bacterium]
MPKTHPDEKLLEKFSRGKLSRRENIKISWHLYNCAACRKDVEKLAPPGSELVESLFSGLQPQELVESPTYERALSFGQSTLEVRGEARDRDRSRAPKLFAELMRHPVSRQRSLIERTWRFKNYVFGEFLLDQSHQAVTDDPARAEDLATLGLVVAEQLEGTHYGPALVNDLKARAWAAIGKARTVSTDLRSADEAFQKADDFFAQGTDDILLKAWILIRKGALRREQRRFEEADVLLEEALGIYREAGEDHLAGMALLSQAKVEEEAGRPEKAIALVKDARKLIDGEREPRLLGCAASLQVSCLADLGRYDEAKKLLPELRKLASEAGADTDALRNLWLEGKVALGMNKLEEAERLFARMRNEFVERGIAYDAALASLDLALVYAQQGRTSEMRQLAEEMLPIFRSRDVHREATAALLVFQNAAKAENVTLKLVRDIAAYLREARNNPSLAYQQAS